MQATLDADLERTLQALTDEVGTLTDPKSVVPSGDKGIRQLCTGMEHLRAALLRGSGGSDGAAAPDASKRKAEILLAEPPLAHAQHLVSTMEKVLQFMGPQSTVQVVACQNMCKKPFFHIRRWPRPRLARCE